jgi:non-ribosomal peptide synthetase component F
MENTESKQWYAQNFDCSDTFSQLIPDLEGTETKVGNLSRQMSVSIDAIEAFCKEHGIFKSTFFTGVYSYLLAKYNNDQEVLFGIVDHDDTEDRLPEAFPIYSKLANDTTVLDFLKSAEDLTTGCREHKSYSIMDVLSDLRLQIGSYFAWNGKAKDFAELGVPLYVMASAKDGNCLVEAAYHANQYSQQLISQFLESYEATLEGFLTQANLCDIDITTESQTALLDSFNQTDVPYDDTQTIVSMFRRQAKATPDKTAVVYKDKRFTYAQLDDMSDRIAGYIASKGLGREDIVAVLIPRSEWMAIASLGVIKAGCAFQPLDPTYPKERLNFMMQDTGARLLIADEELRPIVDEYQGDVIFTKDLVQLPAVGTLPKGPKPDSLFTLVYTSGSTGVPKGGMSEHRNWVAFCLMHQRNANIT